MKNQTQNEMVPNKVLATLKQQLFGKMPASKGLKIMQQAASDFGLNIKYLPHFKIAKKIVLNSIIKN